MKHISQCRSGELCSTGGGCEKVTSLHVEKCCLTEVNHQRFLEEGVTSVPSDGIHVNIKRHDTGSLFSSSLGAPPDWLDLSC